METRCWVFPKERPDKTDWTRTAAVFRAPAGADSGQETSAGAMEYTDLDRRRQTSLHKVRDAWKCIIKKYSALSENEQGDVVDIATGEIIKDTGHLRSLRQDDDNLWAETEPPPRAHGAGDGHGDEGGDPGRKRAKSSSKTAIEIVDLGSASPPPSQRRRSQPPHSQPGDTSYVVSSSQHMTRSKVVGDDNLIVRRPKTHSGRHPSDRHHHPRSKRSGALDSTANDPLNMLSSSVDLGTPSKVRRLRRALDHSFQVKRSSGRRHLHKLILHEKLGSK